MPVQYVKLYKDGAWQKVEQDRVERFLELGWAKDQEKKSQKGSKEKIVAVAEVTSSESEDDIEDWDPTDGDWADSEEAMIVDDELPNKEEN